MNPILERKIARITAERDALRHFEAWYDRAEKELANLKEENDILRADLENIRAIQNVLRAERNDALNEMRELQKKLTVAELTVDEATARRCVAMFRQALDYHQCEPMACWCTDVRDEVLPAIKAELLGGGK